MRPPSACADALVPQAHTQDRQATHAKCRIAATEMPASAGEQGPGETTIRSGRRGAISSSVISSLRNTSTSAPSSPKYCTML
jgi:hypothetical protein